MVQTYCKKTPFSQHAINADTLAATLVVLDAPIDLTFIAKCLLKAIESYNCYTKCTHISLVRVWAFFGRVKVARDSSLFYNSLFQKWQWHVFMFCSNLKQW